MATTFVSSAKLAEVQTRADAPFGALFLGITCAQEAEFPIAGKNSTSSNEETSNDGSSRLDPVYDDDHHEEVDAQDVLCYTSGTGTLAGVL